MKAFICTRSSKNVEKVWRLGRRERLAEATELIEDVVDEDNFERLRPLLMEAEVGFGTWGVSETLAGKISELPNMKAFFYAAGTVQGFARPLLAKDIVLVSSWGANAVPVAQFTLSQCLLSLKCYYQNLQVRKDPGTRGKWIGHQAPGIFQESVSLLGCGMIGAMVAGHLRSFGVPVKVFDPFLGEEKAKVLGVTKVSLDEAFAESLVVSNHLANLPATVGMLKPGLFASMKQNGTFINTGRGATVDEPGMIDVLAKRSDLCALLDVTLPEPPAADSPLYELPNVFLTSHIAGSIGDEVARMADYALEEFQRWEKGEQLRFRVTEDMLDRMA